MMEEAVCRGDLKRVQELIRSGADVNEKVGDGNCSLLILAIEKSYKDIVLALLAAVADVHAKDIDGWTALHWACYKGMEEVVQALIDGGSRVNERDIFGRTPLMLTDKQGRKSILMCLLRAGASCEGMSEQQVNGLFRHACHECDMSAVETLLKSGCSLSILSKEEQEQLLRHGCCEGDVFVARTLVKNGCSISILSREEQEELFRRTCRKHDLSAVRTLLINKCSVRELTQADLFYLVHNLLQHEIIMQQLLRCACCEDDLFAVHTLLKNGCRVNSLFREEQEELLRRACHQDVFVARTLLKKGCSASILFREEQEELLCRACRESDVFVARTLLKSGCRVSILSTEEQKDLLHHACRKGDVFVACSLLKNGCRVSILSRPEQEKLFCLACREDDEFVLEVLLANGCNINCVVNGYFPLIFATENGHEEVVKKLILAGANLGMQTARGDTALHLAASGNNIQCGILLAEGGASVRIKNNISQTPLDLAKTEFKEAIKQALSFTTRKALCIIGNAESGKSTLIAALQAERNSFLGKIFNRFRRVSDCRQRTAGIETVPHCSQRYGEVIFFDFAGQDDYHGPHQMFLESLLSKPGVSMTLLLVVKMTEEEESILHQLHRWLTPVALMAITASPPQVIIIGSFLDKVKSKEEATAKLTRCIKATRKELETFPLEFVGTCFLNCRQPQSKGIDQICNFLQGISIPEFRATHTRYSLAWVLSQIRLSFTAQAVQLQEFSTWVQDNRDNLPQTMSPPEEVCQDLSAAGHALYLPNREDPPKSWLVLDLPSILHDVYGTLFSQSKEIMNEFGLLHHHHLAKLFPHLDLEMVQQLLISLEFCLPVDPSILKVELTKLTQSEEASGWLFFPAFISAKPPQVTSENLQHRVHYFCWQLRTARKHSISAHVLQTILLRLAAHFVVKHHLSEDAQQHCCSIWWNGIAWQSKKDVDIIVHIANNQVIQVMGASFTSTGTSCQYLTTVISDILTTVHQLSPKLAADSYIVHPPIMAALYEDVTIPSPQELFPVADIQNSIEDGEEFSLSLQDRKGYCSTKAAVSDLFGGCTPSLEDIVRIKWPQPEPNQLQSPAVPKQAKSSAVLSQTELHRGLSHALSDSQMIPSGARALLDVSSTPDMRDVDELVVTAVAANWQSVALRLGVEGCVSEVVFKNHPNDCEGACRDMLNRWLRGERHTGEEERTWSTLLTALSRSDFVELERRLRTKQFHTRKHSSRGHRIRIRNATETTV